MAAGLSQFPVVVALRVGKTTLTKANARRQKNTLYLDLELPSDLATLDEAELF